VFRIFCFTVSVTRRFGGCGWSDGLSFGHRYGHVQPWQEYAGYLQVQREAHHFLVRRLSELDRHCFAELCKIFSFL